MLIALRARLRKYTQILSLSAEAGHSNDGGQLSDQLVPADAGTSVLPGRSFPLLRGVDSPAGSSEEVRSGPYRGSPLQSRNAKLVRSTTAWFPEGTCECACLSEEVRSGPLAIRRSGYSQRGGSLPGQVISDDSEMTVLPGRSFPLLRGVDSPAGSSEEVRSGPSRGSPLQFREAELVCSTTAWFPEGTCECACKSLKA